MIEIDNVSFSHGPTSVLDDITLRIPKGRITALIGPNGAGKSTLLSLMARLLTLQAGTIRFDGMDTRATPSDQLARKLAILRQDPTVASRISVRELVGFGRYPHHRGRPQAQDHEKVRSALERFDLLSVSERFVDELSGGQRQRALVAMAFCQETDYLLLDEPLNNLDMYFARELMRLLREMVDHHERTVVVVLHEINYAAAYADQIIALKDGCLAADGPVETVIDRDCLSRIYGMDIEIRTIDGKRVALHHV